MSKQRIEQLLAQLQDNHTQDIANAAAIYTVAHVAVDALDAAQPSNSTDFLLALPAIPEVSKHQLLEQYGSFNGCRKAAKALGIRFGKTPSWQQLEAAFSYQSACQQIMSRYLAAHPNPNLQGVSFEIQVF